jgi:hypothetical protein
MHTLVFLLRFRADSVESENPRLRLRAPPNFDFDFEFEIGFEFDFGAADAIAAAAGARPARPLAGVLFCFSLSLSFPFFSFSSRRFSPDCARIAIKCCLDSKIHFSTGVSFGPEASGSSSSIDVRSMVSVSTSPLAASGSSGPSTTFTKQDPSLLILFCLGF